MKDRGAADDSGPDARDSWNSSNEGKVRQSTTSVEDERDWTGSGVAGNGFGGRSDSGRAEATRARANPRSGVEGGEDVVVRGFRSIGECRTRDISCRRLRSGVGASGRWKKPPSRWDPLVRQNTRLGE